MATARVRISDDLLQERIFGRNGPAFNITGASFTPQGWIELEITGYDIPEGEVICVMHHTPERLEYEFKPVPKLSQEDAEKLIERLNASLAKCPAQSA